MSDTRNNPKGNHKKVTIVIPVVITTAIFMEPCFKALELQICRDFQVLVVDNGSTDGSEGLRQGT